MRTPLNCPFLPGSDQVPEIWAGRIEQLSDWRDVLRPRRLAGLYERGRTVLGEAGLGKSALVRRIARDAEHRGDWVTPQVRIPSGTDPLKIVASAVLELADTAKLTHSRGKNLKDLIDRVRAVSIGPVGSITLGEPRSGPEPYTALTNLLIEVGRKAVKRGSTMVLIHIDEIQNITDAQRLSQILIALGDALAHEETVTAPGGIRVRRVLPLAVYLTGLPDFADMTGTRRGATFARRFKTTTLAPLGDDDLASALQPFLIEGWEVPEAGGGTTRIHMEPGAIERIVQLCCGEPFLFQLAGERAWYAGTDDLITEEDVVSGWKHAEAEAAAHVERILERLPDREQEFVQAMSGLPPQERTLTNIATKLGLPRAAAAGPTSQRLDRVRGIITRGKLYTFRHRAVQAYLTSGWPRI